MNVSVGDYLVIGGAKRNQLVKCTKILATGYTVCGTAVDSSTININSDLVVAVLGPKPAFGVAYKCVVEPYYRTVSHHLGQIRLYCWATKDDWIAIKAQLNLLYKWVERYAGHLLPLEVEIRNPGSKTVEFRLSKDDEPHKLCMRVEHSALYSAAIYGLALHYWAEIDDASKYALIKEYHKLVSLQDIDEQQLVEVRQAYETSNGSRAFRRETDKDVFSACLAYVKRHHNLTAAHLDFLIRCGKPIVKYWPTNALQLVAMEPTISELALKSPEQLWAESVRLMAEQIQLPLRLDKICNSALSVLANQ